MRALFLACLSVILLSGCAVPFTAAEISVPDSSYALVDSSTVLHQAVEIGNVTSSPRMASAVTPETFRDVLSYSLVKLGWDAAQGNGKYILNANVVDFDTPFSGLFNTTFLSTVHYTLVSAKKGDTLYEEDIKVPCVISAAQVWDDATRMRQAFACSIQQNITHLLRTLPRKI